MRKIFSIALLAASCASTAFAASLTLVAPNGGEELTLGSSHEIRWNAIDVRQRVRLVLIRSGGAVVGVIASDLAAAPAAFTWTVGRYQGGTAEPGSNYKVRIKTMDDSLADVSDGSFAIGAGPAMAVAPVSRSLSTRPFAASATTVRVTHPNGGERLVIGEESTITWEYTNARPGQFINVSLVTHPGSSIEEIFNLGVIPVSAGSYAWDITPVFKANFDSLIRLSPRDVGDFTPDNSDRIFALMYPNTTVRILTPNGGENLPGSTPLHIRWEATNTKSWQCFKISLVHMDSDCAHTDYSYDFGIWPIDQREARVPPEAYTREFSGLWQIAITVMVDRLHDARGYYPIALDESDACFRIH